MNATRLGDDTEMLKKKQVTLHVFIISKRWILQKINEKLVETIICLTFPDLSQIIETIVFNRIFRNPFTLLNEKLSIYTVFLIEPFGFRKRSVEILENES